MVPFVYNPSAVAATILNEGVGVTVGVGVPAKTFPVNKPTDNTTKNIMKWFFTIFPKLRVSYAVYTK